MTSEPSQAAITGRLTPADAGVARSVARLKGWVIEEALPLWGETGFDPARGSFVERLTFEGKPLLAAPRRAMVQARQIYVFSHAALLGWRAQGEAQALEAAHRLIDRYHGSDGGDGWVFSVHPDGAVSDPKRDFYAHAFALFGLAWAYKLAPEPRFLSAALATLDVLDRHFKSPSGGYHSALPADEATREQNPHMHLFEAMLAWFEATGREMFLARAAELDRMMAARFFQHRSGILAEYFDGAWNPRDGVAGRICEPGHHFEWSWLLRRYARLRGRADSPIAKALKAFADRHGYDAQGFVVDELIDDGRVHKPSRRSWPLTEAIKAEAAAAEAGDGEAPRRAAQAIDRLFSAFLGRPVPGGWIDHVDASGAPLVGAMPASTLYHVFLAAAEADRLWGEREPARSDRPAGHRNAGLIHRPHASRAVRSTAPRRDDPEGGAARALWTVLRDAPIACRETGVLANALCALLRTRWLGVTAQKQTAGKL